MAEDYFPFSKISYYLGISSESSYLFNFKLLIVLEIVQLKPVSEEQRRIVMFLQRGNEIEELKVMNVLLHKSSLQVYSSLLHRLFINPSRIVISSKCFRFQKSRRSQSTKKFLISKTIKVGSTRINGLSSITTLTCFFNNSKLFTSKPFECILTVISLNSIIGNNLSLI